MKNMSVSRVMIFAVISALAILSLAAPSSAQQGMAPAARPHLWPSRRPPPRRRSRLSLPRLPMWRRRRPNVKEGF